MAEDKKGIVIYADWIKKFEALEDDEAGRLIKQWCESGVDPEQDAYNHLLASDTLTQLTERWSFIGNKMQAVPRIFELKERLKAELSKQPA